MRRTPISTAINTTEELKISFMNINGVEAFLYCQIEGAVSAETVKSARQQSTDLFFFRKVNVLPYANISPLF